MDAVKRAPMHAKLICFVFALGVSTNFSSQTVAESRVTSAAVDDCSDEDCCQHGLGSCTGTGGQGMNAVKPQKKSDDI